MKTVWMVMVAGAVATTGCVHERTSGELTGELCYEGTWSDDWFDEAGVFPLVTRGTASTRIGQVREFPVAGTSIFDDEVELGCDLTTPLTVSGVTVVGGLSSSLTATPDGRRVDFTTASPASGEVVVETSAGSITIEVDVVEPSARELDLAPGISEFEWGDARVIAGTTGAIVFRHYGAEPYDLVSLRGVTGWSGDVPWVVEEVAPVVSPYTETHRGYWRDVQRVRFTRAQGSYLVDGAERWSDEDMRVQVVSPDEVAAVELCDEYTCIGEDDGWAFPLLLEDMGGGRGELADFHVSFRDDDGNRLDGLPADFEIVLPPQWRDANPAYTQMAIPYRQLAAEPDSEGAIVVRAFGQEYTFRVWIQPAF
jgi:hypothetical protein